MCHFLVAGVTEDNNYEQWILEELESLLWIGKRAKSFLKC